MSTALTAGTTFPISLISLDSCGYPSPTAIQDKATQLIVSLANGPNITTLFYPPSNTTSNIGYFNQTAAGSYTITPLIQNELSTIPTLVMVAPNAIVPQNSVAGGQEYSTINCPCALSTGQFSVSASDAFGNPVLSNPGGQYFVMQLTPQGQSGPLITSDPSTFSDGLFYVSYNVTTGGNYTSVVFLNGVTPISNSPSVLEVIQPLPNVSFVSCYNSHYLVGDRIDCTINYIGYDLQPVPLCADARECTQVQILKNNSVITTNMTALTCSTPSVALFSFTSKIPGHLFIEATWNNQKIGKISTSIFVTTPNSGTSYKTWVYIGIGVLIFFLSILVAGILIVRYRRMKREERHDLESQFLIPDSGKLQVSLQSLLDDPQIKKIPWTDLAMGSKDNITQNIQHDSDDSDHEDSMYDESLLGRGGSGSVWRGMWGTTPVAIKRIHMGAYRDIDEKDVEDFKVEIKILSVLKHPNILELYGISVVSRRNCELALVMELMERGSLQDLITPEMPMSLASGLQIAIDVASGCGYLHEVCKPPIIHRDLKPGNILISGTGVAKISDFGISTFRPAAPGIRDLTQNIGTALYSAPEVLSSNDYTEKCDVWSFGVILCEIFTGEIAFSQPEWKNLTIGALIFQIVNQSAKPTIPVNIPKPLKHLIHECLQTDPSLRPRFGEIRNRLSRIPGRI